MTNPVLEKTLREILKKYNDKFPFYGEAKNGFLTTELTNLYKLAYQKGGEDMVEKYEKR